MTETGKPFAHDGSLKPSKPPLPKSLIDALPISRDIMKHVAALEALSLSLFKEMEDARRGGATQLARAYTVLHRLHERIEAATKLHNKIFDAYKAKIGPEIFEADGVTSIPLAEGFRVGTSLKFFGSIKPDKKAEAFNWLRANKLGDLITETVNAQTLGSTAREMLEENNTEPPVEYFTITPIEGLSVTASK